MDIQVELHVNWKHYIHAVYFDFPIFHCLLYKVQYLFISDCLSLHIKLCGLFNANAILAEEQ